MDPTRNLNPEFAEESRLLPDIRSGEDLVNTAGGSEIPPRIDSTRSIPSPESMWALIQHLMAQAATPANPSIPPVIPTSMLGLLSQFGLTGNFESPLATCPQNTSRVAAANVPVLQQISPEEAAEAQKKKEADKSKNRQEQSDFSEEMEVIEAEPGANVAKAREITIQKQIQELNAELEKIRASALPKETRARVDKRVVIREEPEVAGSEIRKRKK